MKKVIIVSAALLLLIGLTQTSNAATGCTLTDPDRDIRRIFPEATNYRTDFISIKERGGASLRSKLEGLLHDKLDEVYESDDVPYAYYSVLKGEVVIGRIHGVNQKGMFGGMQLILATDLTGKIVAFYYQKLTSPKARKYRSGNFTDQFKGLTLADFAAYASLDGDARKKTRVGEIRDPGEGKYTDFSATLRGIHKNLILLKLFYPDALPSSGGENEAKKKE